MTAGCAKPSTRSPDCRARAATNRHHIAHVQLVHPEDLPRFAALGVAANLQTLWACLDEQMVELTNPFLGAERASWQYPFGDLHRSGARLVDGQRLARQHARPAGGDPHGGQPLGLRRGGRVGTEPFLPEQALELATAFAAYTSGSAWVNHRDDAGTSSPEPPRTSSFSTGTPSPDRAEIGATRVTSTWVDGVPVHEAGLPDVRMQRIP